MTLRYQLERFAFALACFAARFIPRPAFLALGRIFGRIAWRVDKRHRLVALVNVRAAFPELSETEAQQTVRACYQTFAAYLFDMLTCFPTLPVSRNKV